MAEDNPGVVREGGRPSGHSWFDLTAGDRVAVPEWLGTQVNECHGSAPIAASRYTDPAFFELEKKWMWPRVWQFAARDEDMPNPGDYVVYENVGRSYLVVRQEDGSVRAFHNVCLHRGMKLREDSGTASSFRCPFHGFEWRTDGTLCNVPCRWDFSGLQDSEMTLPPAAVATWGGYIFVREALDGPTIEEYLDPLPAHFESWPHSNRTTVAWVAKVFPANWKVTAEAFMESFHVWDTHPQIAPYYSEANGFYAVYNDNVSMHVSPFGSPSPLFGDVARDEQWIMDEFQKSGGRTVASERADRVLVPEGGSVRRWMADSYRQQDQEKFGRDNSKVSDSEFVDSFTYNVFPNFSPWGGRLPSIVYRWRPWPDHRATLMEVRLLLEVEPGQGAPETPVEMHFLQEDELWASAPELGDLGPVFDQDMANLGLVQQGLEASKNGLVRLADYQESRIRSLHETLDKYLAAGDG